MRRLTPFLAILLVVNYLDRVNVGFAALQMNAQLRFSAAVYGFGAGVFFIGYAAFEVPSNLLLHRFGARRWLARIMITWGLLSACMALVRSPWSFYTIRFLLGLAEAGFYPGAVYYVSTWIPAAERARAVSWFTCAVPVSSVIGGPLAGLLLSLDGSLGLRGWQWLFLVEALPAVILGVVVLWYLTDSPSDARWLTEEQRAWLTSTLGEEARSSAAAHRVDLRGALTHPAVWLLALVNCGVTTGGQGVTLWIPQILKARSGAPDMQIGLLSAVPYLIAALAMMPYSAHSDRTRERVHHSAAAMGLAAVGFLLCAIVSSTAASLVALSIAVTGIYIRYGPFWALPTQFLTGRSSAAAIALINTIGVLGGFAGTYAAGVLKSTSGTLTGGLLLWSAASAAAAILMLRFREVPLKG